ncbi:MAG: GAF domain-containing protein, partial [Pyrinomonadaceae bacterium]
MAVSAEVTVITPENEGATTLRTIVELVRRIMHADVTSVVSFSLTEETITWRAASGFRAHVVDERHPLSRSLSNQLASRAIAANKTLTVAGIGVNPEWPASDFPVHFAEGIRDLAFTPLRARGETLGALIAGYRTPHHFTDEERQLLEDLAQMAAIALENARLVETVGAAEKIWEQTFDAIGEGILVFDQHGRISRCNTRAAEMIEMQRERVVGLAFNNAFARLVGKDQASFYLSQHRGASSVFEAQADGGRRYLITISSLERTGADTVSVASWTDVTRMSEVQEQLARSRRLGSVGQLAAGVAHEINNPLAAIATCAEAIMRDLRRTESLQALAGEHQWSYYLEEIVRQALRCKDITRGLLDLTQQRQAKRVLCDLNTI